MVRQINKDTTLCMSLAARPSNFGTRFHNYLYEALNLDYIYKAFTTQDLAAAIGGVRALGVRGCAISMPFKEAVIPMVHTLDASASAIDSVNTIVNSDGWLTAYNTDYMAIRQLLAAHQVDKNLVFALRGSGGMAKAVACALRDAGFSAGTLVARNATRGKHLAELYGFDWQPSMEQVQADMLINATPLGMAGGAEAQILAFSEKAIRAAQLIFDVVASPPDTPLIRVAQAQGKKTISGAEVFAIQAVEQFVLYTGIRPSDALFQQAANFARG
ncbi:MAG: shikimate 5-dehydrogenase [Rhodoferax sp.]|nr:shikimate 5-dehydrogenase [Rhodoferax sp.]